MLGWDGTTQRGYTRIEVNKRSKTKTFTRKIQLGLLLCIGWWVEGKAFREAMPSSRMGRVVFLGFCELTYIAQCESVHKDLCTCKAKTRQYVDIGSQPFPIPHISWGQQTISWHKKAEHVPRVSVQVGDIRCFHFWGKLSKVTTSAKQLTFTVINMEPQKWSKPLDDFERLLDCCFWTCQDTIIRVPLMKQTRATSYRKDNLMQYQGKE